MKKTSFSNRFIISLACIFLLVSCDNFLDTEPTDKIHHEYLFSRTDLIQTVLDGTYRLMRERPLVNQKSYDLRLDILDGRDIMMTPSGFYAGDYSLNFDKTTENIGEVRQTWEYYYNIINHVNNILFYVNDAAGAQSEKDRISAEALTLRAFSYFYLINHFQHAWIKGENQPGVPIYLTPATSETRGNPRGTVKNVYDQIISDLLAAIPILKAGEQGRTNKGYVNQNTAKGLLARAYLFQADWENAAKYAREARAGYPLMSQKEYVSGFNDLSNPEWIWGMPFNIEEIHGDDSFFSDYDLERSTGIWSIRINGDFYRLFSPTDCRANLSVNGEYPLIVLKDQPPVNSAINPASPMDSLVTRKFRDKADYTGNYLLMRSSEMYLIEAEAEAELENYETAQNLLYEIQHRADLSAVKTSSTGNELINEILIERRKELYGEGLASTLDIKRRSLNHNRTGNQVNGGFGVDSHRFVWQLPVSEIDANENITANDQNPH